MNDKKFEQKDNTWRLFKNKDYKPPTETEFYGYEYTGSGLINGQEVWVNANVKKSKAGEKYFSGTFKLKNQSGSYGTKRRDSSRHDSNDSGDDCPF